MIMHIYEILVLFFLYGFLGWCTEVAYATTKERRFVNRGFLNGPICPIYGIGVVVVIEFLTKYRSNVILLYIASVVLVSALEWITGFLLEKIFHNKWWDYSEMPLNLNGYICLPFSLLWGVACVFIVGVIQPLIAHIIDFLPVLFGAIMLIVLLIVISIDCYVTASGIFKMNHSLAHFDYITKELHEISDQIGEEIYKKTIEAMDRQEAMNQRISELRLLRDDLVAKMLAENKTSKRLLKAFPKMKKPEYPKVIHTLRERLEHIRNSQ